MVGRFTSIIFIFFICSAQAQEEQSPLPIQLDSIYLNPEGSPGNLIFDFPGVDTLFGTGLFQPKLYSEEEISVEDLFIAANQKKILGKFEEALEIYAKLIEKDALNATIHHDMARIYLSLKDSDKAISSGRKATRFAPQNHWFKLTLVEIYEASLQYDNAANLLSEIVLKVPDLRLYDRWAQNLEYASDIVGAIRVYDRADELFGWEELRSDTKVDLWLKLGKEKEALKEVKRWSDRYPDNEVYLVKLARYYDYRDESKKAIQTYKKVLNLNPDNEEALVKSSPAPTSAEEDALGSMIDDPRIGIDNKILALIPVMESEEVDVLSLCAKIVEQYPENPKSHALYGDAFWLKGMIDEAIVQYKASLNINKSVFQVWDQLMAALALGNDNEQLIEVSNDALDYYPNQAGPYYYQALALFRTEEYKEALEMNEEAMFIASANEGYIYYQAILLQSGLLDKEGATEEALDLLLTLQEEFRSASAWEMIGDLQLKLGDKTAALSSFQKALDKGGDQMRITQKVDSL